MSERVFGWWQATALRDLKRGQRYKNVRIDYLGFNTYAAVLQLPNKLVDGWAKEALRPYV